MSDKREFRVGCMCAGTCSIVQVTEWEWDDEDNEIWVAMYEAVRRRRRFRDRLRVVWGVLRNREPYTHDLCLSPEDARALGRFLLRADTPPTVLRPGGNAA